MTESTNMGQSVCCPGGPCRANPDCLHPGYQGPRRGQSVSQDPCLRTTLYGCSECGGWATGESWEAAWWRERSKRIGQAVRGEVDAYDLGWSDVEGEPPASTSKYGLDDRMVCPRCGFVHADDDESAVDEETSYVEIPAALLEHFSASPEDGEA